MGKSKLQTHSLLSKLCKKTHQSQGIPMRPLGCTSGSERRAQDLSESLNAVDEVSSPGHWEDLLGSEM